MEHVIFDQGAMEKLMAITNGDMRRAITLLQTCHQLCQNSPITMEVVVDIGGHVLITFNQIIY